MNPLKSVLGPKIANTRVVPIVTKIVALFTVFLLVSNFASNYINLVLNRSQILGTTADFDLTPAVADVLNKALPSVVVPPDGVSPLSMAPPAAAPAAPPAATAAAAKPAQKK